MAKKILKAQYEDKPITIGELEIPCAVLEDGTRVLSWSGVAKSLGRSRRGVQKDGGEKLPTFMGVKSLKPFISSELLAGISEPIEYNPLHRGRTAYGIKAELLPEVCDTWIQARDAGVLTPHQLETADRAYLLIRGFSHVGITALVDEATGYQDVRVKGALNKILEQFLLDEAKKYKVTFPTEFYRMIFKLNGWPWTLQSAQKKPGVVAKWTNDLVYDRLAPGLLEELQEKNPVVNGKRKHKHFQFLTDEIGEPRLLEHFGGLIALGRVATSWRKFRDMVERAYPKSGENLMLDLNFKDD